LNGFFFFNSIVIKFRILNLNTIIETRFIYLNFPGTQIFGSPPVNKIKYLEVHNTTLNY